ncbi:MAG: hypothetical protein ACI9T7_000096 [Oleiphilaceae bacterium]|jgi:hypothetical protein
MTWTTQANTISSKGQLTKKATRLAHLAARRELTEGQFFTPLWISKVIWGIASQAMESGRKYNVMDNSVGSGRLLAYAKPDSHNLFGCDIDQQCIATLIEDAEEAGFNYTFNASGVENVEARDMGFGFINPAFSVLLSSPNLFPFKSNSYGKYGPLTNALSQEYCLEHALSACDVVIALLPNSMKDFCLAKKSLLAILDLPRDAFISEGANVSTALFVFSKPHKQGLQLTSKIDELTSVPLLPIKARCSRELGSKWCVEGIDETKPTITLPVTGNNTVNLHHHNNRIIVKYNCGLTQAKVANGLLDAKVPMPEGRKGHRYPTLLPYIGSGRFLIDSYIIQDDPNAAFSALLNDISNFGGIPDVSATLEGYFSKRVKLKARDNTPFRKVVEVPQNTAQSVVAKRGMMLKPLDFTSPAIKPNEVLACREADGGYYISKNNFEVFYDKNQATKHFDFSASLSKASQNQFQWTVINEGKNKAFPELHAQNNIRMEQSGIDFLWPPQHESVSELMMTKGAVIGWEQGCGKARCAIALCLASTAKHTLIAVEGGLVDELTRELKSINLEPNMYKVIASLEDTAELRKINIISYNRLKSSIGQGKRTISHILRRRFGLVAADEGGIMSNPDSQQSRAVARLAPTKLFLLDGTPIGSYPRDMLPLATSTQGSGLAHQPYSLRNNIHMHERLLQSASYSSRGINAFKDDYVVLDWATHEFEDNLRGGAKREIPLIADVPKFRKWADLVVQRRLRNEPDMAQYAGCPRPIRKTTTIKWDKPHFNLYIREAVEFSQWFINQKASRLLEGKGSNLTAVLARIQAVINAANCPHTESKRKTEQYHPLTSKQRHILDRIESLINDTDEKIIVFARSPEVLNRLNRELSKRGIESVLFTGQQDIVKRTAKMNAEFRHGPKRVLLSSYVGQRGLNLEQASRIIQYSRAWSGSTEEQAIARTTRPSQKRQVHVEYCHLEGSIDEYQALLVQWKIAAARSGLDYGECSNVSEEFRHLDSILEAFCHKTLEMSSGEYHRLLAA